MSRPRWFEKIVERARALFAVGEARGVERGAALRAEVAAKLDDEREVREARIRAEAYAQGRAAGVAAVTSQPTAEQAMRTEQACRLAWLDARSVRVEVPCPNGQHSWDADATFCDCGALERL